VTGTNGRDRPDITPSDWGPEPWTERSTLEEFLDAGYTISGIIEEFHQQGYNQCPSYSTVQRNINSHGLTTNHHRPDYTSDWAPLYSNGAVSFPLPKPIADQFDIGSETVLRYRAVTADQTLRFIVRAHDTPAQYAHERVVRVDGTLLPIARVPAQISQASGLSALAEAGAPDDQDLPDDAEGRPAIARFTTGERATGPFTVETQPLLSLWEPTRQPTSTAEVANLEPVETPLDPQFSGSGREATDVRSYRLRFPSAYRDVYELTTRTDLGVNYTLATGTDTPEPALALSLTETADQSGMDENAQSRPATPGQRVHKTISITTYEAGRYHDGKREAPVDVEAVIVQKALLHSVGAGIHSPRPQIRLVPHPKYIELRPVDR